MRLKIVSSTDGRYVGLEFDPMLGFIQLHHDVTFIPDKSWSIGTGIYRFANTNYSIDAKEI